jgi:predicted flap endonuclease-1-like 5' DNA nuclease
MDTLTNIQGLSIAAENRLRQAGITSCSRLAEISPQEIRAILGYLAQGSNAELWIENVRALTREHARLRKLEMA